MISSTDIPKEKFLFNDVKEIIDKIDKIHAENKDPTIEKEFNILIYLKYVYHD